jgi:hypothetical protein
LIGSQLRVKPTLRVDPTIPLLDQKLLGIDFANSNDHIASSNAANRWPSLRLVSARCRQIACAAAKRVTEATDARSIFGAE